MYVWHFSRISSCRKAHSSPHPAQEEVYNIVVCATNFDEFKDEGWVIKGDAAELCERFKDWEIRVRKLCALTGFFQKWRLFDIKALDNWVHPSGRACLLGDSCHRGSLKTLKRFEHR